MNLRNLGLLLTTLALLTPAAAFADVHLGEPNLNALSSGLVGYWSMDGDTVNWNTNTVRDLSGNGYTGTLISMSTTSSTVAGKIGEALKFNGTSSYINAGLQQSLSGESFSISSWFNTKDGTTGGSIYDAWQSPWSFRVYTGSGDIAFQLRNTSGTDILSASSITAPINNNQWYQVVAIYNYVNSSTATAYLYLNGGLVASGTCAVSPCTLMDNSGSIPRSIGKKGDSANYFNGIINDVRVYSRALSAQEVGLLYALGTVHDGNTPAVNSSFSIDQGGLNSGLIGYWPFDGNTTNWKTDTTADVSGNGNTGTLVGMSTTTSPVPGKIGGALQFNGSASGTYVNLGTSNALTPTNFTISAWIKTPLANGYSYNYIYSNARDCCGPYNGINFSVIANGTLLGSIWNSSEYSVAGITKIATSTWAFAAFTYNGSSMNLYVNGVLDNSAAQTVNPGTPASFATAIGGLGLSPGFYTFDGIIDDLRVYNRALSAQEIADLYSAGEVHIGESNTTSSTGINSGLVGYWTFDGPTLNWRTDTAADSSGQGNTGTMIGMSTTSSPTAGKIGQALKFNGSTSYINAGTGSSLNITGAGTIAAWIKPSVMNAGPAWIADMANGGSLQFGLEVGRTTNKLDTIWGTGGGGFDILTSTGSLSLNTWQYVAVTRTGSGSTWSASLYINGILDSVQSGTHAPSSFANAYIGSLGTSQYFDGTIDDVRIYNRALSSQEIQDLYDMGR